ncbi:D-aspartate oxidase [Phymastichus coffea]|uniref:D-aspartate oxidase n=1 Tax=Phymastichus coffea TaxID=108790 RepID=UPI00273B8586|nr:D-aspartate oxidase [Phymastichus coffea]XP_058800623.1 D-aspartate oxidase [Phymastichus coffea]
MKIAVLGGGCVGLTTALQLQENLRNSTQIDVIAEDFGHTTSHVAAGIFRVSSTFSGPSENITKKWITDSYNYYEAISRSSEGADAGVTSISGYMYSNNSPKFVRNEWMENLVPIYRQATESELKLVGGSWKYGAFLATLLTQPNQYLPWARAKLQENGATLIEKPVDSLKKLFEYYDLIINCTGLGARTLCNDNKMIPIKGHVWKVRTPWLKTFFYGELDTYIIPGADGITTLGGNREFECDDLRICPYQMAAIRERCEKLIPSLKKAKVVGQKTGLRPYREGGVRVEAERVWHGPYKAIVVHNYGHGGYGICMAPGTSKYVVELAKDAHKSTAKL